MTAKKPAKKKVQAPKSRAVAAFVADIHIRNYAKFGGDMGPDGLNARGTLCLDVLQRAIELAGERGCCNFVVAGDFFDQRRPEPGLIRAVQEILEEALRRFPDMPIIILPGNHDCIDASPAGGNVSLAPLRDYAVIPLEPTWYCLSEDPLIVMLAVPFDGTAPMREILAEAMKRPCGLDIAYGKEAQRVLVTHVGIYDAHSPPFLRSGKDAMDATELLALMHEHNFKKAFVGNYHRSGYWASGDSELVQVGTLCPKGWADPGEMDIGGVHILKTDFTPGSLGIQEIPGPRFFDLERATFIYEDFAGAVRRMKEQGSTVFLRGRGIPPELVTLVDGVDNLPPEREKAEADGERAGAYPDAEATLRNLPEWYEGEQPAEDLRDVLLECWMETA